VYSLDESLIFDPFDLGMDISPAAVREAVESREFTKALVIAFRLSEEDLIHEALEAVPVAGDTLFLFCLRVLGRN
jgi:periodic tryptophan protein 2